MLKTAHGHWWDATLETAIRRHLGTGGMQREKQHVEPMSKVGAR